MAAMQITKENFEREVLHSGKPVLVDFFAEWCGPCQMVLPIVEELAEEVDDVKIAKVNIDEQRDLARKLGVMSIPTLMVFKDGKVVQRSTGAKRKPAIVEMMRA